MKKYCPAKAEAFTYLAEMDWAAATNDAKTYAKNSKAYAKKIAKGDSKLLHKLAQDLSINFRDDPYA